MKFRRLSVLGAMALAASGAGAAAPTTYPVSATFTQGMGKAIAASDCEMMFVTGGTAQARYSYRTPACAKGFVGNYWIPASASSGFRLVDYFSGTQMSHLHCTRNGAAPGVPGPTTVMTPAPARAAIGARGVLLECATAQHDLGRELPGQPANIQVVWWVAESEKPGHALVCMAPTYLLANRTCFRTDAHGNLDASLAPWANR